MSETGKVAGGNSATVIRLQGLSKRFGAITAVDAVSLDLYENEFFALLGPSGCGKTTLLRLIAGFESPDAGQILLDGEDLTPIKPNRRPVNLMFQSYALFPHMSVEGNVAYGLEMERLPKPEIARRVGEVLEMAQLGELRRRRPHQLSGGQRQRVALARALVKRPRVLLLDEPLGALDRKLREQMQLELKRLQHEIGITFVVVTHDQEEALVMADRIALLDGGRLAQIDSPRGLYEHPRTRFVAGFIGSMNFFEGHAAAQGVEVEGLGLLRGDLPAGLAPGSRATLAVRPERLALGSDPRRQMENNLNGEIREVAYHGQDLNLHIAVSGRATPVTLRLSSSPDPSGLAPEALTPGARVVLSWSALHSRILEA